MLFCPQQIIGLKRLQKSQNDLQTPIMTALKFSNAAKCVLRINLIILNIFIKFLDLSEVPICEVSISCDNLLCDGHGRPPNPVVLVHVYLPTENVWIKYAKTEVIEVCL